MKKILLFLFITIIFTGFTYASGDLDVISTHERLKFFLILIPAAIGDSINPCAFAVMFILLSAILKSQKSRSKVLLSGFLFTLAVFISYLAMGLGLYSSLSTLENMFYLQLIAGLLGIVIGLANMKDYFWYGKYFKMEVPDSWRPKMFGLLKKVVSPIGAFFVGFLISLFLLPCTSGPYIMVLSYLAAESATISTWGYIYIFIYNLIFIIPMIVIALLIGFGFKNVGELKEYKELNVEKMHLITGIIMILLGAYILFDILI